MYSFDDAASHGTQSKQPPGRYVRLAVCSRTVEDVYAIARLINWAVDDGRGPVLIEGTRQWGGCDDLADVLRRKFGFRVFATNCPGLAQLKSRDRSMHAVLLETKNGPDLDFPVRLGLRDSSDSYSRRLPR